MLYDNRWLVFFRKWLLWIHLIIINDLPLGKKSGYGFDTFYGYYTTDVCDTNIGAHERNGQLKRLLSNQCIQIKGYPWRYSEVSLNQYEGFDLLPFQKVLNLGNPTYYLYLIFFLLPLLSRKGNTNIINSTSGPNLNVPTNTRQIELRKTGDLLAHSWVLALNWTSLRWWGLKVGWIKLILWHSLNF